MHGQPVNNPDKLRVIQTARTQEAINEAAVNGFFPLIRMVTPSPEIYSEISIYQSPTSGEMQILTNYGMRGGDYRCVLPPYRYYPYSFPQPFAAYLLPKDLVEGERVWLDDVIEDIVASFGMPDWRPRLEACEAIWTKGNLKIVFEPEMESPHWIG